MALGAERFHREIRLLARLRHPFVLPLHDSGEAAGALYFVMPYIEGESLRVRLDRKGKLPVDENSAIDALEMAAADHADWMYSVGTQPAFRQLRSNTRFVRLMERLELPLPLHESVG